MWLAYGISVVLFALGALFPVGRTWGLEAAAWLSPVAGVLLLILAAAAPLSLRARSRVDRLPEGVVLVLLLAVALALFVTFRAHARFLGDGAQNLGLLAEAAPPPKITSAGTWWLLLGLRRLAGGDAEHAARLAYQLLSIGSGVAYVLVAWFLGRPLVEGGAARRLLAVALLTGGWTLQFFGYFENYAPFLVTTTAFALAGAKAARDGRGRGVAMAWGAASVALHALGLLLLPAVLLLFRPRELTGPRRLALAVALAAGGVAAAAWFVGGSLERQLLFVPPFPTRFGVPGYTMFSLPHLLDVVNLALLLLPGLLVVLAASWSGPGGPRRPRDPAHEFLVVVAASCWLGVFVFDPKLGLPRDWDLFAFAGPPLLLALLVPRLAHPEPRVVRGIALAAALGAVVLAGRVATNTDEATAYRQFRRHLALDPARGRNARYHALAYLRRIGREDLVQQETAAWLAEYPERRLVREAIAARDAGDLEGSIRRNLQAIRIAPDFFDAWNDLGTCYLRAGRRTEAREAYDVALALNPGYPGVWINLGLWAYAGEDWIEAQRWWERAWKHDPRGMLPNKLLARVAQKRGDGAAYERYFAAAATASDAPPEVLEEWARHLAADGPGDAPRTPGTALSPPPDVPAKP